MYIQLIYTYKCLFLYIYIYIYIHTYTHMQNSGRSRASGVDSALEDRSTVSFRKFNLEKCAEPAPDTWI